MSYLVFSVIIVVLAINIFLLILWFTRFKVFVKIKKLPKVSVLVAARNEESTIRDCINSLLAQNYPKTKLEILIGNDASEDKTAEIVNDFKADVTLIDINANIGKAKGKANVLAHLAKNATGEVFLITDADIAVNPDWVQTMVSYLSIPEIGIVNGSTAVENSLFQHYEWLYFQGLLKIVTDIYTPVTAIGNNMLITREAYEKTGGYENIDFSITEDHALFEAVRKCGYKTINVLESGSLAFTKPVMGIANLLQQRKRWMHGAVKLPVLLIIILGIIGLYGPALIYASIIDPAAALSIFLSNVFVTAIFLKSMSDKLGIPMKGGLLLYSIYSAAINFLAAVYFIIPIKIRWKERVYND